MGDPQLRYQLLLDRWHQQDQEVSVGLQENSVRQEPHFLSVLELQTVPDLEFFNFTMVQKLYEFNRNHTLNGDF